MNPADVNSSTYISSSVRNDDRDPKFEVGNHVRISKHKKILAKRYTPYSSEETVLIKNDKNIVAWYYLIKDLNRKINYWDFLKNHVKQIMQFKSYNGKTR